MLYFSPFFIRPNQGKTFTKVVQTRMPWRQLGVHVQHSRPVMVAPSRFMQSTVRQTWHNRRSSYFQTIRPTSTTAYRPEDGNASSGRVYDLSLQLSQRPINGNALIQYTLYNSQGVASLVSQLTKLEVAARYGLSTRDLRIFDLPSSGFPHILVRENTILLHLFDLRLLVQSDQVLHFQVGEFPNPGHGHGISQGTRDNTNGNDHGVSRVFSHNLEGKLRDRHGPGLSANQPYELRVMEATLASVTSVLEAQYLLTEQQVSDVLQMTDLDTLGWEESLIHNKLRTTLDLTRKLASIEQRARQVRNVAQEVLDEDEDMANMYLTDKKAGKPHALQDHQDVEYLFEAYFKASDAVAEGAASLIENIRRTEEAMQSTLRVRRNQIMVLEAKIEILMVALASATLVAGWYGMNVINYFEESPHAFIGLVSVSSIAVVLSSWYGMRKLRYIRKLRL